MSVFMCAYVGKYILERGYICIYMSITIYIYIYIT